ncbi:MAG: fibrobacter succinogenes major paralogous domain-containing protein, partial [Bacteroidales bacterium]|nr:fibrobacter succinogenes major paralogous domain-containing protein [Bacteroidales bacterium]
NYKLMLKHLLKFSIIGIILTVYAANKLNAQTPHCVGDEFILHAESYVSGELQWQYSLDSINWYDYYGETSLTCTLILENDVYLRLKITDPECMPEYYAPTKHIKLTPLPSEANAGEDQLNITGTTTTLNATAPVEGTGFWSITSGSGGVVNDVYANNSEFGGNAGETYILRWLVFNDCGYNQDNVTISFATETFNCGDLLVDARDSQSYPTVEIGGKCWMAANLNVGTQITGTTPPTDNSQIEKYCYGDDSEKCNLYGGLYQWNEAMGYSTTEGVQGICPAGWHLPSDDEVKQLEINLGMIEADADLNNCWRGGAQGVGTAMKEGGSSGLNIQLAGRKIGSFGFESSAGYMWCSTEGIAYPSETHAMRRCWGASSGVGRYDSFSKTSSFSVRCVKD